jgi:hypothetical protein
MATRNLLLSGGERLTSTAKIVRGGGTKKMPYSLDDVREAIAAPLKEIETEISTIESAAKPRGEGVFEITLHPSFLARSYYPAAVISTAGLRDVGSRERTIVPRVTTKNGAEDKPHATASIFVAGQAADVRRLGELLDSDRAPDVVKRQLREIESVNWISTEDKLRGVMPEDGRAHSFEVALHAGAAEDDIVVAFKRFAASKDAEADLARRIRVGGLTFLPLTATVGQLRELSKFTFLRVARPMPPLRIADPALRRAVSGRSTISLPSTLALHPTERAAIFDGGLGTSDLDLWAIEHVFPETATTVGPLLMHGSEVTSTFLFGRAGPNWPGRPYMNVDHFRVLGTDSGKDPDLFDVLLRVKQTLETGDYKFANLSLGPRMPISDDEVHAWTATLDQLCATYGILITVAVGNDGDKAGADRIQPPGDMVNALAVGSCDSAGSKWKRAPYSCIGPGRSPGYVKPDGVAFGGTEKSPFEVYSPLLNAVAGVAGTSYSSPLTLRTAAGISSITEMELPAILLKALLIHSAEPGVRLKRSDVGWGRFAEDPNVIVECGPASATIMFNGFLAKGEFRRCPVPFPDIVLPGGVQIKATFCINAQTDPEHAVNYTKAGMGIVFRPLLGLDNSDSTEFFGISSQYKHTERELRDAAHKWETVQHRTRDFRDADSLAGPVFDVEYHARSGGRGVTADSAPAVEFALVVTVTASDVPDFYDLIRAKYPVLTPVQLRTDVQVGT